MAVLLRLLVFAVFSFADLHALQIWKPKPLDFNGFVKAVKNAFIVSAPVVLLNWAPVANADSLSLPTSLIGDAQRQLSGVLHAKSSPRGFEVARRKRTAAIKSMESKGIIKISTDDSGNQFLSLPWIPDKKLPYKSLSVQQRLINEVSAGAFGEISKDLLLHWVDTAKTRRQIQSKLTANDTVTLVSNSHRNLESNMVPIISTVVVESSISTAFPLGVRALQKLQQFKGLYAGFPVVALASIPQGGAFFLVKKGFIEWQSLYAPQIPEVLSATVPICLGVMAYWLFRTPAEVIKTQVQAQQQPNVTTAFEAAKRKGLASLWKYYTVMLSLDIPFQIVNFILFGLVTDAVNQAGYPSNNILTRLFCGVSCGMVAAAVTCPLDVCKTRIISRDKKNTQLEEEKAAQLPQLSSVSTPMEDRVNFSINYTEKDPEVPNTNRNVATELLTIFREEGLGTLFLGFRQRLLYTGLANGIRLSAYGTSKMDLMMRSLDDL